MKKTNPDKGTISAADGPTGEGRISRRSLLRGAVAVTAGGTAWSGLRAPAAHAQTGGAPLVLAEQGQFWVGVERRSMDHGTVTNGGQMYVWYQFPAEVRHPFPVVLVHGGGGQGTDYLGTPYGGPGWATYFLQEGYRVYVVDRPGLGRSPFYPQLLGDMGAPLPYEVVEQVFTAMHKAENPHPYADLHTQWAGDGEIGDPVLDQFMAGTGASIQDNALAHRLWRTRGTELLDVIGPAILLTHSAGGPFGWLTADERPDLVRALVDVETAGPAGLPLTYDPPITSPDQIQTQTHTPTEDGVNPYPLQVEPARQLVNLQQVPIVSVVAEASSFNMTVPGAVAYLRQAGVDVELMRLVDHGVRGHGHFMMMENDNREALQPILDWLERQLG